MEGPVCVRRQMGMKMVGSGSGGGENCRCWLGNHEIKWAGFHDWLAVREAESRRRGWEIHLR